MPSPNKPFRINVGFIIHEAVGRNHDIPFEINRILIDDLELKNLNGNVNIGKTPQGLVVQSDFSSMLNLECVRCLKEFSAEVSWSFTDLYAFDKRSETESELILAEDAHIDLAPLVREYALLEVPINPVCKADCKGLCVECGQNLNDKDCGHRPDLINSPFAKLKDLL